MKHIFLYGLLFAMTAPVWSQTRYLPHITAPNSDFETWIILENTGEQAESFELHMYGEEGHGLPFVLGSLEAGTTESYTANDLLGSSDASHVVIGSEAHPATHIRFTLAYGLKSGGGSRAYSPELGTTANQWRLFAGNWDEVYDAIAVINPGSEPATVNLIQRGADGTAIRSVTLATEMAPNSKTLFVISSPEAGFDVSASTIFEISADQPVGVIALQGDQPASQYLWVNPSQPR